MKGEIEILDSTQRLRWEDAFNHLPERLRDINFSYAYHLLYERNGDGDIRLFLYREGEKLFYYPFLIRTIPGDDFDSQFNDIETVYGYSGPVSNSDSEEFVVRASQSFKEYCIKHRVLCEFIRYHPLVGNEKLEINDPGLSVIPLRDYVYIDLNRRPEEIWNQYSPQNRNKIRKAEKSGVKIDKGFSRSGFEQFVGIYLENMKRINAPRMYFFSDAFFDSLAELVQEMGTLYLARLENEILGAAAFLHGHEISHYFLASATSHGKQLAAGNLLLHTGVLDCHKRGSKQLHLGGGVSQEANDPLLVFKENFSKLKTKFYIGKRIHDKENYERVIMDWEERFPEYATKYKAILQRYRLQEDDMKEI